MSALDLSKQPYPHSFAPLQVRHTAKFYALFIPQLVLFPIVLVVRAVLLVTTGLMLLLSLRILTWGVDMTRPVNPFRRVVILRVIRFFTCPLIWFFGYRVVQLNQQNKVDEAVAPIIVSNHIHSFDAPALVQCGYICFISKSEVRRYPLFGFAGYCSQHIYVNRRSPTSRAETRFKVFERSEDMFPYGLPRRFPALAVFAEGTTNNGLTIMPFKSGAFEPGMPVAPVCIDYDRTLVDHTDSYGNKLGLGLLVMGMLRRTTIYVSFLPIYVPSAAEVDDASLYAENVRRYIASYRGRPLCDMTYADKAYFTGHSTKYEDCSEHFQKHFGRKCTKANGYYLSTAPERTP